MAKSVEKVRRPHSLEAMLKAGVQAINESGVDRISVSQIANLTGHTRPTFYSYFGDTNGLLAEIWLEWGPLWLTDLEKFDYQWHKLDPDSKNLHHALCEIIAVAHRSPEVLEVVEPALEKWWQNHEVDSDLTKMKLLWLVAERIGTTLTAYIDEAAISASFIEVALASMDADASQPAPPPIVGALPSVSNPGVADETVERQLVQAAINVIATSGVAAASMARIARKAQVSTGTIYPRFANLTDLVDESFELSVSKVIEQNFSLLSGTSFQPDDFGSFVMAGLTAPRKAWRNFRIEIHLEGRLRESLKSRMKSNLFETNKAVARRLAEYPFPELVSGPIPYLIHVVGIGFAILLNAGIDVNALDHRVLSREMVAQVAKLAA
jgi:AcrR family transcriptional regulator